jgi:putative transposase
MGIYASFQQENFKAINVAVFLRHLLRHLPGNIILLWDRGRIHKGPFIKTVLHRHPRLQVEWFPAYAPELNPVEQVWQEFKHRTANSLYLDKKVLRGSLHANVQRVRRSQAKLRSFVLASDLPSPPWRL